MIRRPILAAGLAGPLLAACSAGQTSGSAARPAGSSGLLVFGSDGNVQSLTVDGSGRTSLTKVAQGALAKDPAWTPDGKRIAYALTPPIPNVRGPGGLPPLPVTDLYVMNADGSDQKVLIPHDAPGIGYETPFWLPDGKSLIVTYTELVMESNIVRDQIVEVARVTPGGGARQTLVPNGAFPAVSKDGQLIACVISGRDGRQSLVVTGADGKNQRTLLPPGQMDGIASPRFSPDGKQIAFSAVAPAAPIPTVTPPVRRTGNPLTSLFAPRTASAHGLPMDVFVMGTDGSAPKRLTQLGEDNPSVAWSPDGKRIAILAGGGIYVTGAAGEDFRSIDSKGGHGNVDWRPI